MPKVFVNVTKRPNRFLPQAGDMFACDMDFSEVDTDTNIAFEIFTTESEMREYFVERFPNAEIIYQGV